MFLADWKKTGQINPVILEHAILDVAPGEAADYEAAVKEALPLIAATPGFIRLEVRPCLEKPGRYLLAGGMAGTDGPYGLAFAIPIVTRLGRICCIAFTVRFPWWSISANPSSPVRSHQPLGG